MSEIHHSNKSLMSKLVSIVIPVYNEEQVLPELLSRLQALFSSLPHYQWEVVLVENGSVDKSLSLLLEAREKEPRFRVVQLSRNFTADGGVAAGLQFASGQCAVLMDADLQDPPEMVSIFLQKWEKGAEVVYGIIHSRKGVPLPRKIVNSIFYFLINKITKGVLLQNVTAFRLMDRRVYEVLNRMPERNRFTRGLCAWTGFKQEGVKFDRAERFAGDSKAAFFDICGEALDAFFSFSFVPLRIITFLGICISFFCFFFLILQLGIAFANSTTLPGYRTLIVLILMMFGFMFISLGVVGEYVARIFDEVKQRPLFVVKELYGFD